MGVGREIGVEVGVAPQQLVRVALSRRRDRRNGACRRRSKKKSPHFQPFLLAGGLAAPSRRLVFSN